VNNATWEVMREMDDRIIAELRAKCQRYEATLREIEDHTCEPGYYDIGFKTLQAIARKALKGEGE
jgi:hypothetical protein